MSKTVDHELTEKWKVQDATELYGVRQWGKGYFGINKFGHVTVHPTKKTDPAIDLKELVDQLQARGIQLPILLRFTDILRHRIGEIHDAFEVAMKDSGYAGDYCCVYPIKVNQQRHVVEEFLDFGKPYDFGLEAGSKPELLAVLAMTDTNTPIICNGFKDDEFIRMAMLARKIGKQIIPVVENFTELEAIVRHATELDVRPAIGVRVKLAARGAGRWRSSAGYRAKFGLTLTEVLEVLEYLKARDMADCLQMVHFHIGSQITNIRKFKDALTEGARVYTELHRLGAGMKYLDVGGGLGVDYDGSQTDFESSINYTLEEYANDVVFRVKSVCDEAGAPHPIIISESGRAVVAYHSVLVFDVLGSSTIVRHNGIPNDPPEDAPQPVLDLFSIHRDLNKKNFLEGYHDAIQAVEETLNLFTLGYMPLELRAMAERLFWSVCGKVQRIVRDLDYVPEELQNLETILADTYFCNFSVFQSMPDSWAVKQLFPLMPIHRLDTAPNRQAVLGDITCDSDGKVDQFIDLRDVKNTLPLHDITPGEPYYLGTFLLGAYQEILGDLHNLFGDTNAVHVSVDDDGIVSLDEVIKGDTVREVLHYVQYSADKLAASMRRDVEKAVRAGKVSIEESRQLLRFYENGLEGYTYLEEP
ncbi:MAG: biosynthetic arginine decarboxylase [Gemmataceae bacterium]